MSVLERPNDQEGADLAAPKRGVSLNRPPSYRNYSWTAGALLICVLFGLALIANVQLVGDGSWYWYANLARHGFHLYSDLKMTLQPLFVLETEATQTIFGDGWVASKVPAVVNLATLTLTMFALTLRSRWSDRQRAILLVAAFFLGIRFEAYRFDDYHVASDCFVLLSALLLLNLPQAGNRSRFLIAALLGILSGLTAMTRLNDGALLFLFTSVAVLLLADNKKIASAAVFALFTAMTAVLAVALTGDSLVTWATYSVLHVGAIKGGTSQFVSDPARLLTSAYTWVVSIGRATLIEALLAAASWSLLVAPFWRERSRISRIRLGVGSISIAGCLILLWPDITDGGLVVSVHALLTLGVYLLPVVVLVRAAIHFISPRNLRGWNPREVLLALPLAMMASGSLSSAGLFNDLCMDSAMLILFVPAVATKPRGKLRSTFLSLAMLTALSGAWYRYNDPASWISYTTFPLFQNRQIIRHPNFGPMIIDNRTLRFMSNICPLIHDGEARPQLLSMPWPYSNYYCDVAPWHNYVQTWFDTTSKAQIDSLITELETGPPQWIVYQRQLGTLAYHEQIYNNGLRIPQRDLDDYISAQIATGRWRITYREQYGIDSDWLLIRTRWSVSRGANLLTNSDGRNGFAGWRTATTDPVWRERRGRLIAMRVHDAFATDTPDTSIAHPLSFERPGRATIGIEMRARELVASPGTGYTADLFDPATQTVLGSLGWSDTNTPARRYAFAALVENSHEYLVRFRYNSSVGMVSFSKLSVSDSAGAPASTSSLAGWQMDRPAPKWTTTSHDGGCFNVTNAGEKVAQTTLLHTMRFATEGPVTVQMRIGAPSLTTLDGYGFVSNLYDVTQNTIVASLGVPAQQSGFRSYSFTGNVNAFDSYQLRLQYAAAAGDVSFCRVKVESGTVATPL